MIMTMNTSDLNWLKLDSPLQPDERLVIAQKTHLSNTTLALTILQPQPTDAGKYLCTAQNSVGSDQRTIDLHLEGIYQYG